MEALQQLAAEWPWVTVVVAVVTALGAAWSALVTVASLAARILESRGPDGAYLFDYPRLRAVAHELALTPKTLRERP